MFLRPPRSTLFPTRRSSDLSFLLEQCPFAIQSPAVAAQAAVFADYAVAGDDDRYRVGGARLRHQRSEEHTSELQSRGHLVCRLLLEKKKKRQANNSKTQTDL